MLFYIHFCKQQRGTNRENYVTVHLLFSPSGRGLLIGGLSQLHHSSFIILPLGDAGC